MVQVSDSNTLVLFGGTFDPPHLGHLHCIKTVMEILNPRKFIMLPSAVPPVKDGLLKNTTTSFDLRSAMCRALVVDGSFEARVEVLDIEKDIQAPNYTWKTINRLDSLISQYDRCYFLIGDDQIENFHLWHNAKLLLSRVSLLVMRRKPEFDFVSVLSLLSKRLGLEVEFSNDSLSCRVLSSQSEIRFIDAMPVELSSTEIREDAIVGTSPSVSSIINTNKLYLGE